MRRLPSWLAAHTTRCKYICINILTALMALGSLSPANAETRTGGTLRGTHEWTKAGSPYIITKDIVIPKGSTLHIGPGVTVRFKPDIANREGTNWFDLEVLVKGTLIVEGAPLDSVYLTTDALSPRWTDWQGIVVQGPQAKVELSAAVISNCNEGVKCFQGSVKATGVTVTRNFQHGFHFVQGRGDLDNVYISSVGNSGGTGIGINATRTSEVTVRNSFIIGAQNGVAFIQKSTGTVDNTMVSMCASRGIIIRNASPEVSRSTITGNDYGLALSGGAKPTVHRNNIFDNTTADLSLAEYGGEPVQLDFSNNWWGEVHLGLIEERILDGLDDEKVKGFVNVDPVLTEANTLETPTAPDEQDK